MHDMRRDPGRSSVSRSGFTLIELLVVVAIIALLISILLPALGMARKQARQLVCNTNLRSQGQAAYLYAADNRDFMIRGINDRDKTTYAIALLRYLGYSGHIYPQLWVAFFPQTALVAILKEMKPYQCPDHPVDSQTMDYVASAFPIPQTETNINDDVSGGGTPGDQWQGETPPNLDQDYISYFKFEDLGRARVSPARLVLTTEGHRSLGSLNIRFHHVFYTSQLPFGSYPRIANDARHPGGLNGLFYDGHAETIRLTNFDVGWPHTIGTRSRYMTTMPPGHD
ncbi:MAG: hypothetical protein CHACPFDD_04050 [Phycisphaerae bacterium]|nr:hypothetical protein [Phycisphaerae bacterium]